MKMKTYFIYLKEDEFDEYLKPVGFVRVADNESVDEALLKVYPTIDLNEYFASKEPAYPTYEKGYIKGDMLREKRGDYKVKLGSCKTEFAQGNGWY